MFESMVDFFTYGVQNLFNLVILLSSSITYGINFIISTFLIVPNIVMDLCDRDLQVFLVVYYLY